MKLLSYRDGDGASRVGVVQGELVHSLELEPPADVSAMLHLLREGRDPGTVAKGEKVIPLADVTIDPIVPDPGKVVAAPVNYRDHQTEMQEDAAIDSLGVFLKAPTSVLADGSTVQLPYTDRRFDQEGELAVVIGRHARHLALEEALDAIAGYTVLLDMTMRGGEDRSTRKSFDTFTPVGPWLVTPDEAPRFEEMRLRTWVSGELRQDADITALIWDVPSLLVYVSSVMTLRPGDIVTTGTPAGIGEVKDADTVEAEIDGIGRLRVTVSSSGAVPCPTRGASRGPKPPEVVTPVRRQD